MWKLRSALPLCLFFLPGGSAVAYAGDYAYPAASSPTAECVAAQLRLDYSGPNSRELLAVVLNLKSGTRPQFLSETLLAPLRAVAGVKTTSELSDEEVLDRVVQRLKQRMGQQEFDKTVGASIGASQSALIVTQKGASKRKALDLTDLNRGWGWKLLRDDDPAFKDPEYLARYTRLSGNTSARVLNLNSSQMETDPWKLFALAWKAIAPKDVDPSRLQFSLTGTDANNRLYEIVEDFYAHNHDSTFVNKSPIEILAFDGVYGGGAGRIGNLSLFHRSETSKPFSELLITSPDTVLWDPKDPTEVARLVPLEDQAIQEIKDRVSRGSSPIGGLLLEPILGAKGVRFYRPEFLSRLRSLCDQLNLPIIADEILTGGGRTGTFFAYQHYQGFEPDLITFGKGLQVSGVAQTDRGLARFGPLPKRMVTLRHYGETLLKSAQIMTRIREGHLMKNARLIGDYWVDQLRKKASASRPFSDLEAAQIARGKGMLIYSTYKPDGIRDAVGRLLPPLTLNKQDVDLILNQGVAP
jgi:4-aminobutyrate aminotransferase-like enzyme